jgi:hypothetical protein
LGSPAVDLGESASAETLRSEVPGLARIPAKRQLRVAVDHLDAEFERLRERLVETCPDCGQRELALMNDRSWICDTCGHVDLPGYPIGGRNEGMAQGIYSLAAEVERLRAAEQHVIADPGTPDSVKRDPLRRQRRQREAR